MKEKLSEVAKGQIYINGSTHHQWSIMNLMFKCKMLRIRHDAPLPHLLNLPKPFGSREFEYEPQCVHNAFLCINIANNKNNNRLMTRFSFKPEDINYIVNLRWLKIYPIALITKADTIFQCFNRHLQELGAKRPAAVSHASLSTLLTHFTYFLTFYRLTKIKLAVAHKHTQPMYACVYT